MAELVLTNAKIYADKYDLSGESNKLALKFGAELKDKTNFGSGGTRQRIPGLFTCSLVADGFWGSAAPVVGVSQAGTDTALHPLIGLQDTLISVAAAGVNVGDIGYFFKGVVGQLDRGAKIGDLFPFVATAGERGDPLLRGTLMATGTKTTTANGAGVQVGAISATQKLYAGLHIFEPFAGVTPTLTVKIQSNVDNAWGAPTDRITFTAATGATAQYATPLAGAITDQWWRAVWTFSGGSGYSVPFVVWMAIR
jgi:hypothetical protein